jgi:beta-barrel assembly-enhancing protease
MNRRFRQVALSAILAVVPLIAVAGDGDDAPPVGYVPQNESLEAGIWHDSKQVEAMVQQSPLLVHDAGLNAYVRKLVCDLAGERCASLRVYIIDMPVVNASCYPNGMVLVETGLLLRADNEAQLAFVLGHELTHYFKRHSLRSAENHRDIADVVAFIGLGAAGAVRFSANVNVASAVRTGYDVVQLVAFGSMFAYDRAQETEADEGGFDLAVKLGYDPRQGAILWTRIDAEDAANPHRRFADPFFATHPTTPARIKSLTALAEKVETDSRAVELGTAQYHAAMAPHRSTWLAEELDRGAYDESLFLVSQLLAAEPHSGELQFFLGEGFRRRNAKGDLLKALDAYNAAIADGGAPAAVYRSAGVVNMKTGNGTAARDAFQRYLSLVPSADDRPMIESYLAQL